MDCRSTKLAYKDTGYFSQIIIDYLDKARQLGPFYRHEVSLSGIEAAIKERKGFNVNRDLLVQHLEAQYRWVHPSEKVKSNIQKLRDHHTFTITTAHQPALFTGTLYFVYKILHAIKLSEELNQKFPQYNFVPVYWMGSEDADLEELGKFYLGEEKIVWDTKQKGAVGKMNTKGIDKLIQRVAGELSVQPYGKELVQLLETAYLDAPDIQTATFKLLHSLFEAYGLITIIPDTAVLKRQMIAVFEDDLFNQKPSAIVSSTIDSLAKFYKVQANPREINLFYFKDSIRSRIYREGELFKVFDSSISFTPSEIREELNKYPERFSPNVILRGLFQETILPNIAFIGGGGETAYWLELKDLFDHYRVPFPVLVLRNSFLFIERKWQQKIQNMGFAVKDFFKSEQQLLTELVSRNRNGELKLAGEMETVMQFYDQLKSKAAEIDKSLLQHVEALRARALKPVQELEKKLLRAEKRKFEAEQRQIHTIKKALFPQDGLQERIDNFMPYYAKWGKEFIELMLTYSLTLEQEFMILAEN
jgi:bacillithiol biosynthesis cysteine-adding enzyme BshC